MKIAILGAGGHLGTALCREAVSHGDVLAFVRKPSTYAALQGVELEYRYGDLEELDYVRLFEEADHVIDAAAPYPLRLDTPVSELNSALARYKRMADALVGSQCKYSYISSFVTLERKQSALRKLSLQIGSNTHPYYVLKRRIEQIVLNVSKRGGNVTVYCPSICIGPWNPRSDEQNVVAVIASGKAPFAMNHLINVIDVRDVAKRIVNPAKTASDQGRKVPVFGHSVTIESFARIVSQVSGAAKAQPMPSLATFASLAVLAEGTAKLAGESHLPESLPLLLCSESYTVNSEAELLSLFSITQSVSDSLPSVGPNFQGE